MLKIRLRRMGTRNAPFYRVVVSDQRKFPTSTAVEEIGYYDPRRTPAVIEIDRERVDHWVGHGAQLSKTVQQLLVRDPAKEKPKRKKAAPAQAEETAEAPAAEAGSEETVEASAAAESEPEAAPSEGAAEAAEPASDETEETETKDDAGA